MQTTDKLLHLFKDGAETAWPELATGRLLAGLKESVRAGDSETITRWRNWLAQPEVPRTIRRSSPILEEDAAEWIHRNAVLLADGALGALLGAPGAGSAAQC